MCRDMGGTGAVTRNEQPPRKYDVSDVKIMSVQEIEYGDSDFDELEILVEYERQLKSIAASCGMGWRISSHQAGNVQWKYFLPANQSLPIQGYKIHVSAAAVDAIRLLHDVVPLLIQERIAFKVPGNLESILHINSMATSVEQIGKVLTIYPCHYHRAFQLADVLDKKWRESNGPVVSSDWQLQPGGKVSLRYGTFGGGPVITDSTGRKNLALVSPDGLLHSDNRSVHADLPAWVPIPPFSLYREPQAIIDDRIKLDTGVFFPLRLIHRSSKGDVMISLDYKLARLVILKTARRGAAGDLRGTDAHGKLYNEFAMLNGLREVSGIAPRAISIQVSGEIAYAVMEFIAGTPIMELALPDRLEAMICLARGLAKVHAAGYVHRDLKLSNVLLQQGHIRLLDWELSARSGARPRCIGGTNGYLPPEGVNHCALPEGDIYAFGCTLFHALTGYDPSFFPNDSGRLVGMLHLIGMRTAARLVSRLSHEKREKRLSAACAAQTLVEARPSLLEESHLTNPAAHCDRFWIARSVYRAGIATRKFKSSELSGCSWRNNHLLPDFKCVGINLGASGIILGLATLDRCLTHDEFLPDIIQGADWLQSLHPAENAPGLFMGNAGIALALGCVSRKCDREDHLRGCKRFYKHAVDNVQGNDLFGGRAGVVLTACWLSDLLGDNYFLSIAKPLVSKILSDVVPLNGVMAWPPLNDLDDAEAPFTGAAHGSAGIALALAKWSIQAGDDRAQNTARQVFHDLFSCSRTPTGDSLQLMISCESAAAPIDTWCHGPSGYLWSLLNAFADDNDFKEEIDWGAEVFAAARPLGNPTYCHGLAGQLEICRMLMAIPRHAGFARDRAQSIAASLRLQYQRHQGDGCWGAEEPQLITPDLWLGFLGPASALALYYHKSTDPLLSKEWLSKCVGGAE
jgi:serine/threonine protein kinase